MAIEGSLDLFRLPEILQVISQENKTGILTVQGDKDIIAISFSHGRVVAADALNQTLEEGLGETLEREGLLARPRYEAALNEQRSAGGRLIDVLVDRGYLERSELLAGLRRHTSDLLVSVLAWEEGDFKFYTNEEVSYEEGFDPISVEALLLDHLEDFETEAAPEVVAEPGVPGETDGRGEALPAVEELTSEPEPAAVSTAPPAQAATSVETTVPTGTPEPAPAPRPAAVPRSAPRATVAAAPEAPIQENTVPRHLARLLGAAALLGVACAFLLLSPFPILVPLPWSQDARAGLEELHRQARAARIESAVETYQLLEGAVPERLEPLTELDLLTPEESTLGPDRPWTYEPLPRGFELSAPAGATAPGQDAVEYSVRGDFFLDPDFFSEPERLREPPLILLD